jgi:tetratricopeptide (TPR) repeat protein
MIRRIRRLCLCFSLCAIAFCQKQVKCSNGEIHFEIDVQKLALNYAGQSFQFTLSGLSALGARVTSEPKTLLAAAEATQQWNELLKGLAAGYNSCAVSQQQYNEGLNRIYPRLKDDAAELEQIRQMLAKGQQVDAARFRRTLDSYFSNLRQFAEAANIQTVEAIRHVVEISENRILQNQEQSKEQILSAVKALEQRMDSIAKPAEVSKEVAALRKELDAQADTAEKEYSEGYRLLHRFQFRESIPHLQAAIRAVPLPQFYEALATAFAEIPDLKQAEQTAREGLQHTTNNPEYKASLATTLGMILFNQGNLAGAKTALEIALYTVEVTYGRDDRRIAPIATTFSVVLRHLKIVNQAEAYARRAVQIDLTTYGKDNDETATALNNLALILQQKGDLEGAKTALADALQARESLHGHDSPGVALLVNNVGLVEMAEGKLDEAKSHFEDAIRIQEVVYGPNHPELAISVSNLGIALQRANDLEGAISNFKRSLQIDETVFGPSHTIVAVRAGLVGDALWKKGDLTGARSYFQKAFDICNSRQSCGSASTRKYADALRRLPDGRQ